MARTHAKRRAFLKEIKNGFSPTRGAKVAGETLAFFKKWKAEDENFAKDWADAEEQGSDELEDVAVKRSKRGSDFLLSQQLKARRPEKYRERSSVEHSGSIDLSAERASVERKLNAALGETEES